MRWIVILLLLFPFVAQSQTTTTVKVNLLYALYDDGSLRGAIIQTAQDALALPSVEIDTALNIAEALTFASEQASQRGARSTAMWWEFQNAPKWQLNYGYKMSITAGQRAWVINQFNTNMKAVAVLRKDEWDALSQ